MEEGWEANRLTGAEPTPKGEVRMSEGGRITGASKGAHLHAVVLVTVRPAAQL